MEAQGIGFIDEKMKKAYESLKKSDPKFHRILARAFDDILNDLECGIKIGKSAIPKSYIQKYNISVLWKYNLPGAWRLLYTVKGSRLILAVILDWMEHKKYERFFRRQ